MSTTHGLRCPACGGTRLVGQKRFTTPGILVLLVGLFLAAVCIGLPMIFIAFGMREVRYTCLACRHSF